MSLFDTILDWLNKSAYPLPLKEQAQADLAAARAHRQYVVTREFRARFRCEPDKVERVGEDFVLYSGGLSLRGVYLDELADEEEGALFYYAGEEVEDGEALGKLLEQLNVTGGEA
jgi:hypothetical protein